MKNLLLLLCGLLCSVNSFCIESLDGFLVSAFDEKYRVVSPEKFKNSMEVIIENKTLMKLIGKIVVNNSKAVDYVAIDSEKYQRVVIQLKKGDVLHFYPLSPAFQEVELIVGNKTYEIPPKK